MRMAWLAAALVAAPALAAAAEQAATYDYEGSFEDAVFELESAITDRGLVVDHVSHVGDMLNRTGQDVGSDVRLFDRADVYLFCSALLSRKVMEADPSNIAHCPYGIFLTESGDTVQVGYRRMPDGPMQEVEALLDEIAREVTGN